jgi:tetratricopeptide (TPR) repeat protein
VKPGALRRLLGLSAGAALIAAGSLEIAIARSDFESAAVRPFCRAGLCADQFSLERVFEISQKATLGDPRGELEDFKQAIDLSPASAYRWADLGEAEFNVRDISKAEYAFSQALKAGPRSPVIRMRAANLYFQIGDEQQVSRNLMALLSDPGAEDFYQTAFLTYSRLGLPISEVLSQGVPQRKDVLSRLLTFWTNANRVDEAVATWQWADERSLADKESMRDFFAFLIRRDRQPLAQQLWQDRGDKREPNYRVTNWIYNPGFESLPELSPFDWTIDQRREVEAGRVQDVTYAGTWSFRIRFNGESNLTYYQTYQDMVLPPGRYKFSAMVKTDHVTTDEGMRLHISDHANQSKLNLWTDTAVGTQDWKRIEKQFDVPEGIKLIRLEIARTSSTIFDNKIGGTAWIDDLRLSRQ